MTSRDGGWRHVSNVHTSRQYGQSQQSPRRAIDTRRMGFASDFCYRPVSSMQIHAASIRRRWLMYLLQRQGWERQAPVHHSLTQKKGSRQELLCGADSTRSPATKATVPGRRDSAHTPPSGSHWPRISRAHQGIEAVAAAASSLTSTDTPPALHLVRHAGSPEACERHRKLRPWPLWAGAAACRGVQCAGTGTGTEETNRRRAISHSLECVSHTLRKCNVMPDGEDADRWLWNHEEQLLARTNG